MAAREEPRGKRLLLSDAMKEALGEVSSDEEPVVRVHHVGRSSQNNFSEAGIRYQKCGGGYRVIRKGKGE